MWFTKKSCNDWHNKKQGQALRWALLLRNTRNSMRGEQKPHPVSSRETTKRGHVYSTQIQGLSPAALYTIHIYQAGICSLDLSPATINLQFFPSCCTEIVADLFPRRVMGTQLGQTQHELHVGALEGATSELQQYWGWMWFLEFQIRVRLALFWSITTTIPNHFIIFFCFLTLEEILASARTNTSQVERAGILKKSLVSLIGDSYKEYWKVPETLLVPPKECKLSRYDRWTPLHLPIPHPPEVLAAQASREFSNENIRKGQVIRTETLWRITLPSEYFHARINWGATFPERDPNKAETEIRDLKSLLQYTLKD